MLLRSSRRITDKERASFEKKRLFILSPQTIPKLPITTITATARIGITQVTIPISA